MKTENAIARGSFPAFLSAWIAAGKPAYLPGGRDGFYLGTFPVHSSNHVEIDRNSLPAEIVAKLPDKDSNGVHCDPVAGPSWTQKHGVVIDISYSCYQGGWNLMGAATYLPDSGQWVHPSTVHSYRYD